MIVDSEVFEEQLDYEEDECNSIKKKQESKVVSLSELPAKTTKKVNADSKNKNENGNHNKKINNVITKYSIANLK